MVPAVSKVRRKTRCCGAALSTGATLLSSAGYVYDGLGQRVQKMTCNTSNPCTASAPDATVTTYVYDAFGNLAQEYGPSLIAWCGTPTCYLTQDQVGSTRLVTDANGLVDTRYDYLPFGEELPAGTGARAAAMGYLYSENFFNPKFGGQMRDPESARDYMGFRYYSPQEGRFVSVDPGNAGADATDPQTWNGYAYVGNNPLVFTDPDGLGFWSDLLGAAEFASKIALNILTLGFGGFFGGLAGGTFGGGPVVAGIASCGGPLGLCGSLGDVPWSENTGLGDVQDPGRFVFDAQNSSTALSTLAGGATGFGAGLSWAVLFENNPTRTGQARLGRPGTPRWQRSFHLDVPHPRGPFYEHFNAEFGPLLRFNHARIPAWAYSLGSARNLKIIGGSALSVGVAVDVYNIATSANRCRAIWGATGGWVGGTLGLLGGSALAPGAGTFLGGAAGGIAGGYVGDWIGQKVCQ